MSRFVCFLMVWMLPALAQAKEDWRKKPTEGLDMMEMSGTECQSDEDCAPYEGFVCKKGEPTCSVSKKSCRKSWGCKIEGKCKLDYFNNDGFAYCNASNKGCRKSMRCKESGRCALVYSMDINSGVCGPTKAKHCRKAMVCKKMGLCSLKKSEDGPAENACVALTAKDCAKAEVCTKNGQCRPQGGKCVK